MDTPDAGFEPSCNLKRVVNESRSWKQSQVRYPLKLRPAPCSWSDEQRPKTTLAVGWKLASGYWSDCRRCEGNTGSIILYSQRSKKHRSFHNFHRRRILPDSSRLKCFPPNCLLGDDSSEKGALTGRSRPLQSPRSQCIGLFGIESERAKRFALRHQGKGHA